MHISEFDFPLPDHLIAQEPPPERGGSRLLHAPAGQTPADRRFCELPQLLDKGDLLVFNNTKVIKARLFGHKASGGRIEALVERILGRDTVLAHIRASKAPKNGSEIIFDGGIRALMEERADTLFRLRLLLPETLNVYTVLETHGLLPLPPYITRSPDTGDETRYQTVYAKHQGAVAAPTAGLHFTPELLDTLDKHDIRRAELTLHVGAGTFQPVRCDNIDEHIMHSERYHLPEQTVRLIEETQAQGKRVWAVGTTSLRCLEAAAQSGRLQAGSGETDIFITPGHRFRTADGLITNFHLPKSTLLMLVSAFSGMEHIRRSYRHAVEQGYRFFSYGDAMMLTRAPDDADTDR